MAEHGVHLRLQVLRIGATAKLMAFRVERELSELVDHRSGRQRGQAGTHARRGLRSPWHLHETSMGISSISKPRVAMIRPRPRGRSETAVLVAAPIIAQEN